MLRRISILLALAALLVGVSTTSLADPGSASRGFNDLNDWGPTDLFNRGGHHDDDEGDDEFDDTGFGAKIAGTWELKAQLDPNCDPEAPGCLLTGYQTWQIGETFITTDQNIYVGSNPLTFLGIRQWFGAGHGTWERTEGTTVSTIGVLQGFYGECPTDGSESCEGNEAPGFACCDPALTGQLFLICTPVGLYEFAPDYDSATTHFKTLCYLKPDDPTAFFDEGALIFDSEVAFGGLGVGTLRRVEAPEIEP